MNLENITLSERSQSQKTTYGMIPFICNVHNREIYSNSKQISGCLGLGVEEEVGLLMGSGSFLFGVMKMV